jgi:hypothetical protein
MLQEGTSSTSTGARSCIHVFAFGNEIRPYLVAPKDKLFKVFYALNIDKK